MSSIADILLPAHVNLSLAADDKCGAVDEVIARLSGDGRVRDFERFRLAVEGRDAAAIPGSHCGICIAHGRTESVTGLVMAAGRSRAGFSCPEVSDLVHLVFVAGIPAAMKSEYLRIVGAVARICRDPDQIGRLLETDTAQDFIALLGEGEMRL